MTEDGVQALRPPLGAHRLGSLLTLASGELVSSLGVQIALFAVPLFAVMQLHASPLQMGVLNLFDSAAALCLGLVIGTTVDRLSGVTAVAIANVLRFLAVAMLGVMVLAGPALWELYVGMFIVGAASLMHDAGVSTAVVELGERGAGFLNRANALLRGSSVVSELAGAGIAGVLVVALGFAGSLLSGALGFALAALCAFALLRLRPRTAALRETKPRPTARDGGWLVAGLRFIWSHELLRPLVLSTVQFNFFTAAFQAVFLFYCVRELRFSATDLAIVGVAAGAGGLVGSALVAARQVTAHQKAWYASSLAAPVAALAVILLAGGRSLAAAVALVSAAEFVWSCAMVVCVVLFNTLRQLSSPAHLVGQIAASERVLALAGEVPGALLGGYIGSELSARAPMVGAMIGIALSIAWLVRIPDWSPRTS